MRSGRVFKVDMCSMWTLFKMDVVQDGSVCLSGQIFVVMNFYSNVFGEDLYNKKRS